MPCPGALVVVEPHVKSLFAQLAILGGEPIEGLSLSIAWGKRDSGLLELAEVLEAKEPRSGKDQFKMLDGIANGSL